MSTGDPLGNVRVLVVDDDEALGSLTATFLDRQRESFEVSTATSGTDALSILETESVDCVVSDYEMPGMDGIELLRTVRDHDAKLAFILYTARGSEEVASEAISAGVTDYLQKGTGSERYALLANRIEHAVRQRRAERIATETQRRLEEVTGHTNDVLYMFDGEFSELLFVNDAYEQVYGQSVETVESDPQAFMECIHPEDREQVAEGVARLTEGEQVSMEYRVNEAEGYSRWVDVEGTPVIRDGEIQRIVGAARDVTEQRERRRRTEESRERFRALFEESPDGNLVVDEDGQIVQANQTFVDTCGYDRETLRSMTIDDLDADGESSIAEQWGWEFERDEPISFESRYQDASGTIVPVEVWVTPLSVGDTRQYLATIRDISEWQARETRLDALYRTTQELLAADDRADIAAIAVRAATDVLGLDINSVYTVSEDSDRLVPLATSDASDALFEEYPEFEPGSSIAWEVYESGDERVYEDVSTDADRYNPETPIRAEIILPLGEHGIFIAGSTEPAAFDEGTIRLARLLANTTETMFDRTAGLERVRTRKRKIQQLQEQTDELIRADSVEAVAELAIETAETVLDMPFNGIHLVDEDYETLEPIAVSQAVIEHLGEAPAYSRTDPDRSADRFNWDVFESGEPRIIEDTHTADGLDSSETPTRSGIVHPLGEHGVFVSTADWPNALSETEMALVDLLTAVITAALDQLKSQAELRDERNLLANIFEQIPVHLFVKDTEARHLRVSTHLFENADIDTDALEVEDFSPSTVTGKTDVELYRDTEQYRQSVEDDLRVIETGEPLLEVERYDPLIDEWFLTSKVPWYDAEGTCKGIMGVATEITTQKEYERELERQNDRLDSFASMVSHDLRNPLGVVQGRIELALETEDITHLEPAQRAATRMGELIDDMLWLAKEGHNLGAVEAVDVATVARESWAVVDTSDARLSVETDTTVQADRSRLAQVFENLFSNAIEHAGSEVTVRVGATQNGIYVSDDGPGMPATERASATEIGVSGRPDGTGLGLAIVREIATAHGWEVTLRESESRGLCVELEGVTFTETSASESQTSGQ